MNTILQKSLNVLGACGLVLLTIPGLANTAATTTGLAPQKNSLNRTQQPAAPETDLMPGMRKPLKLPAASANNPAPAPTATAASSPEAIKREQAARSNNNANNRADNNNNNREATTESATPTSAFPTEVAMPTPRPGSSQSLFSTNRGNESGSFISKITMTDVAFFLAAIASLVFFYKLGSKIFG